MYHNPELTAYIKSVTVTSKEEGDEGGDLIIRGYANTISKDRAGDVIPASTWRTSNALTNFLKNPILLAFHDHRQPIGEITEINITELGLEIVARVVKSAPEHIYGLIKDGILKAFSVGFNIKDADYDHDKGIFLITDLELLEVSVVSVPCNQDSIFSLEKSLNSKDYSELREKFCKEPNTEKSEVEKLLALLYAQK